MTVDRLPRENNRFELLCWQIELFDNRRAGLENRASITVSITALVFGGFIFLVQQTLPGITLYSREQKFLLLTLIVLVTVLLTLSLVASALAIASVYHRRSNLHGSNMPARLFFYPHGTFEQLNDFTSYQEHYNGVSTGEMMSYMLGELWAISREYQDRHKNLRWAVRLLLASVVVMFTIIVFLFRVS